MTFTGSGTPQVSLSCGDASVTFMPANAAGTGKRSFSAADSAISVGAVRNCAALSQLTATGSNTATYENVFGSADLVYVLENEALKEYIILENRESPNSFTFRVNLEGVTLQQRENGGDFVNAAGETVFHLGSLFAIDANGVPTDDLSYTFQVMKDSVAFITVTLDPEYLAAEDRAFPVVIDPTTVISSSSTPDACVCEYTPDTNYQVATQLRTGACEDFGKRRSYIKFDLPSGISADSVTSVRLDVEKLAGVAPTIRAYRVTESWSSASITWRNQPDFTAANCSQVSQILWSGSSWYIMDVTSVVKAWLRGTYSNYGFALIDDTEDDLDHWTTLYSSDAASPHKPELRITYNSPVTPDPDPTPNPSPRMTFQYIHYYDTSFPSGHLSKISAASSVASAAYLSQFNIAITSGSPSGLNTLAGACGLGNSVPCSSACDPHHKDVKNNAYVLSGYSGVTLNKVVYWQNRPTSIYCQHDEDDNCSPYVAVGDEIYAVVYSNEYPKAVQFLTLPSTLDTSAKIEAFMGITLIHETAHTLHLPDTYHLPLAENYHSGYGYQCAMEYVLSPSEMTAFYAELQNGENALCEFCAEKLETYLP